MSDFPNRIGKYRIEGELGRGAMGVVYRAFDPVVERQVALKTIHVSTSGGIDLLETLRREAKSVGRFEHPNIVTLFDAGEIEGMFCMVMQLVEGESLRDRLQRQRWFKVSQVVDMFGQILAGLGYAHQRGIVHRDIKPANIMISAEGVIKLADFGIAKLIGPSASSSGLVVGTPSYMSPEQVLGRAVDARSDIFSVGCTLYEVLTGEKAFPGDSASSVMYKIVHDSPAPPTRLRPGADPSLEAVALKALANDPADRYANCREMAAALEDCLKRTSVIPGAFLEDLELGSPSTTTDSKPPGLKPIMPRIIKISLAAATAVFAAILLIVFAVRKPALTRPLPIQPPAPITRQTTAPAVPDTAAPAEKVEKPLPAIAPPVKRQPAPTYPRPVRPTPTPDDFTTTLLRGDVAFQQSKYEAALAAYLQADTLKPGNPGVRRKLKVVLTLLGRAAEAQKYQ